MASCQRSAERGSTFSSLVVNAPSNAFVMTRSTSSFGIRIRLDESHVSRGTPSLSLGRRRYRQLTRMKLYSEERHRCITSHPEAHRRRGTVLLGRRVGGRVAEVGGTPAMCPTSLQERARTTSSDTKRAIDVFTAGTPERTAWISGAFVCRALIVISQVGRSCYKFTCTTNG